MAKGKPSGITVGTDYASLLADFQKREAATLASQKAREREIRGIYGQEIAQYEEGGAFRRAGLADIEQAKTRAIGAGTQQMISSGLYGTTTAASIPVQAEAQAGQARLKLEDLLQQRVTEAKRGLAGFVERIEEPYPDYNTLLQASIAAGEQGTTSYGKTGGRKPPDVGLARAIKVGTGF
jgi:hypothetical protein